MLVVQFTTNLKSNSFVSHAILSFYSHSTISSWSLTLLLTSMWPEVRMHTVRALDIISYLNNWVKRTGLHTYKYTLSVAARCWPSVCKFFRNFASNSGNFVRMSYTPLAAMSLFVSMLVLKLPVSQPFPSTFPSLAPLGSSIIASPIASKMNWQ